MEWYPQKTPYTAAVASLMMALHHIDPSFVPSPEIELEFWQKTTVVPTKSPSIYGLAMIAQQHHVPVRVVVGQHEYKFPRYRFQGYRLMEVELASKVSELSYKKALEANIPIEERDFTLEEPLALVKEGKIILLRLDTGFLREHGDKLISHYLVLFEEDGSIKIADPARGIKTVETSDLQQSFLAVQEKCKRDHRMMVLG